MRRRFGLSVAMIVSLDGCVDDPTFVQADAGADSAGGTSSSGASGSGTSGSSGEAGSSGGTSSGGTSSSGTSGTSSSTSSTGGPPPRCVDATCKGAGGSCSGDTCVFNVAANAGKDVTCPAGVSCQVTCNGKNACKKVTCNAQDDSCSLNCSGDQSCTDQITLRAKSATLLCTGKEACKKVSCTGAACAVTCNGGPPPACEAKDVMCCASSCTVNGLKGDCPK